MADTLEKLALVVNCPLCQKKVVNARSVKCCYMTYCQDCIEKVIISNGRCPNCKNHLSIPKLLQNPMLDNVLLLLKMNKTLHIMMPDKSVFSLQIDINDFNKPLKFIFDQIRNRYDIGKGSVIDFQLFGLCYRMNDQIDKLPWGEKELTIHAIIRYGNTPALLTLIDNDGNQVVMQHNCDTMSQIITRINKYGIGNVLCAVSDEGAEKKVFSVLSPQKFCDTFKCGQEVKLKVDGKINKDYNYEKYYEKEPSKIDKLTIIVDSPRVKEKYKINQFEMKVDEKTTGSDLLKEINKMFDFKHLTLLQRSYAIHDLVATHKNLSRDPYLRLTDRKCPKCQDGKEWEPCPDRSCHMQLYIKGLTGKTTVLDLPASSSCLVVTDYVENETGIYVNAGRYIFAGKQLEMEKNLSDYNLQPESTLHLVLRLHGS
jgi:hypothetical protein